MLCHGVACFASEVMLAAARGQVVPTAAKDTLYDYSRAVGAVSARREWLVYLQAGAGIVADSVGGPTPWAWLWGGPTGAQM